MRKRYDKRGWTYFEASDIRVTVISGDDRHHSGKTLVSFKSDPTQRGSEMLIRNKKDIVRFIAILTFLETIHGQSITNGCYDQDMVSALCTKIDSSRQPYFDVSNIRLTFIPGKNRGRLAGGAYLGFREYVGVGRQVRHSHEMCIYTTQDLLRLIKIMRRIKGDMS